MVISQGYNCLLLIHSAKGSEWEKHKYIKRIDGTYYYPDSYEGGRHLPGFSGSEGDSEAGKKADDFEKLKADLVAKGEAYEPKPGDLDYEAYSDMDDERFKEYYESYYGEGKFSDDELKSIHEELKKRESSSADLSDQDVENLARETIKGNFGNGQIRKDLLGANYEEVQKKVNEILKGSAKTTKVSEAAKEVVETGTKALNKAVSSSTSKTPDLDQVWDVYRKKNK